MHEAFDIHVVGNVGADVSHGLQIHLAGEHDASGAEVVQRVGGTVVRDTRLRGDVQFQLGATLCAVMSTPMSVTISASTPVPASWLMYSWMALTSLLRGNTLQVTYTRAPRAWA